MGNIYGRVYLGNASRLDIKDVTYGEGASKYLISNGTLHVFNGLEKRLPMYDENTYIKSTEVAQTVSSKQFMRFKKATFVRHNDGLQVVFHPFPFHRDFFAGKADLPGSFQHQRPGGSAAVYGIAVL